MYGIYPWRHENCQAVSGKDRTVAHGLVSQRGTRIRTTVKHLYGGTPRLPGRAAVVLSALAPLRRGGGHVCVKAGVSRTIIQRAVDLVADEPKDGAALGGAWHHLKEVVRHSKDTGHLKGGVNGRRMLRIRLAVSGRALPKLGDGRHGRHTHLLREVLRVANVARALSLRQPLCWPSLL